MAKMTDAQYAEYGRLARENLPAIRSPRANATDPAKLLAIADELDKSTNALAAAVSANTSADAPPAEPPA